ncbi:MAG: DUF1028 domain-containing protein [Alphaproteobacteria bacterium]
MTFSIIARCPRTGALGVGTATGEMAVGSRVPFVRAGVGAVATQALTNPALGVLGLNLLGLGYAAAKVLDELAGSDPFVENRQLAVVDLFGRAAARTGTANKDWKGHHVGDGFVAMGNKLVSAAVVDDMASAFAAAADAGLAERLCRALEAGRDAGGQPDGQRSAALLICEDRPFPAVDLRVDRHAEPVGELRALLEDYTPLMPYYRARAADPSVGPWDEWLARNAPVGG